MSAPQRLIISNFKTGLETDRTAFNINNDAFPTMENAYVWRGRIRRKRGTSQLGRLQREFETVTLSTQANGASYTVADLLNDANINVRSTQPEAVIVPGTLDITVGAVTFADNGLGVLVGAPGTNSGTINYSTGALSLTFNPALGGATNVVVTFTYFPSLPVMGLEDFDEPNVLFPILVAFDTRYSYQHSDSIGFFDVSFYKTSDNPVIWTGQDYQQFWTTNYQGAMWATNNNPGFHMKPITGSITINTATTATIVIASHGLVDNDYIFVNETNYSGINLQTGYVTHVVDANTVDVTFPQANMSMGPYADGIALYLTSNVDGNGDGIRWYDGFGSGLGWVNFSPPLQNTSAPEYLVGAQTILPFKDRLLFFAPYVQTSSRQAGSLPPVLLEDTVIYSQNGTVYFAGTNGGGPGPIIPENRTFDPTAWFQNITGKGGFLAAGIQQQIVTVSNNEDVIICGFDYRKSKLVYTGNDLLPFIFQTINVELGAQSTFSAIPLDVGVIDLGPYGFIMTSQTSAQRIDLVIPDQVFTVSSSNNGVNRVTAHRDFQNEWIYFTYPSDSVSWIFPNQTLQFNYRDNTWAIFDETYTHYGNFRPDTGYVWNTLPYNTWNEWTDPWNYGAEQPNYPLVVAGNAQGFVMIREIGTGEGISGYIFAVSGNTITSPNHCLNAGDFIIIQDPVNNQINGTWRVQTTGSASTFTFDGSYSGSYLGGATFTRLYRPVIQTKQFNVTWPNGRGSRIGLQKYLFGTTEQGQVTVQLFVDQDGNTPASSSPNYPDPDSENDAIIYSDTVFTSPEFYSATYPISNITQANPAQVTSSTVGLSSGNQVTISGVQGMTQINGGPYTVTVVDQTHFTLNGIDSTGFGAFTPSSTAQWVLSFAITYRSQQQYIWHRLNNSLVGDSVQIGITLSDEQMVDPNSNTAEISLHAIVMDLYPGPVLAYDY